jgi:hypothetical protein
MMETADILMAQESSHVEITNEDNTHHFFDNKGLVHFDCIPQDQ